MSGDAPEIADGNRESLAAEYVLKLLTGGDLLAARGRVAKDPAFAEAVAAWEARLVPLFDLIDHVTPHSRVWEAIAAALHDRPVDDQASGEVVRLRRQVRRWRAGTGIAAALAGVFAVFGLQDRAEHTSPALPSVVAPPAPLVAALAPKGGGTIGLVYHPGDRRVIALATALPRRARRDLELWVLPPGGAPLALGILKPGRDGQLMVPPAITAKLVPGSTVAVSLEPVGGSPTGLPTGPVLATAKILPA